MTKYEEYTFKLASAMNEVFDEESDNYIGDIEHVNATMLFTAMLGAVTYMFNDLTGDDKNLIETTHLLNSLAVQHVVSNAKEESE